MLKIVLGISLFALGVAFALTIESAQLLNFKKAAPHKEVHSCPQFSTYVNRLRGKDVCRLSGLYTQDIILSSDKIWSLKGEVIIGGDNIHPSTINIQSGTTIMGEKGADYLLISRGSKIFAIGSKFEPIIFTSKKDVMGVSSKNHRGEWGGIVIAGNAPTNINKEDSFEFILSESKFGGVDDHDNSGVLNYVVIKYAGHEVAADKELNGLSLGGVGDGTTIDYLEVYNNYDDGIEIWGGSVNLKHIVLIGNGDDNLDTDHGYRGKIQYLYVKQTQTTSRNPRGIEADNLSEDFYATPIAYPIIANFELHGTSTSHEAILLRRGSGAQFINGKVSNFTSCLGIRDRASIQNSDIRFDSVALSNCQDIYSFKRSTGVHKTDIEKIFHKGTNNKINEVTKAVNVITFTKDTFFDEALFIGAYEKNKDWREEWTVGLDD